MRLSEIVDRLFRAIADKRPDLSEKVNFVRGFFTVIIQQYGDLELGIRIVPKEAVVVEEKKD
jgi:hypothetical protein